MNDPALQTIEQAETLLTAAATVEFRFEDTPAGYAWIQPALARFDYATPSRPHTGPCVVIRGRGTRRHLIPYLNYHRPCFFPHTVIYVKGKQKKHYRYEHMMTPYEKLTSLPEAASISRRVSPLTNSMHRPEK